MRAGGDKSPPAIRWAAARIRPRPVLVVWGASMLMLVFIRDLGSSLMFFGAFLALLYIATPLAIDDFWLSVLNFTAIAAIAAIGLNLLTGFTGQVSLGHAFFLGLGAYTAGYLGGDLKLPVLIWLPAAGG